MDDGLALQALEGTSVLKRRILLALGGNWLYFLRRETLVILLIAGCFD